MFRQNHMHLTKKHMVAYAPIQMTNTYHVAPEFNSLAMGEIPPLSKQGEPRRFRSVVWNGIRGIPSRHLYNPKSDGFHHGGGFLEWGYPYIIHVIIACSIAKHPANYWDIPMTMETLMYTLSLQSLQTKTTLGMVKPQKSPQKSGLFTPKKTAIRPPSALRERFRSPDGSIKFSKPR